MRSVLALAATGLLAAASPTVLAQVAITSQSSPVTVDFNSFNGTGFAPAPGAGQLDSDTFSVTGLEDGACAFGATCSTGDFARGVTTGPTPTTGGIYAFDLGAGNAALGFQPTGGDFTPGTLLVRIDNTTGGPIDTLDLAYDIIVFNSGPRGNVFNLAYGFDAAGPFTAVAGLNFTSPDAADAPPAFATTARTTTLSGLAADFQAGDSLFLQFSGNDSTGSGTRDKIGIDNLTVEATSVPVELMQFSVD